TVLPRGAGTSGRSLPARAVRPRAPRAGRQVAAGAPVRRLPQPQPECAAGAGGLPAQPARALVADDAPGGGRPMKGPAPLRRVVYVVSLFPCWSETFIVREIDALVEAGVDVRVLSLKPASEALVHDDAAALLHRVRHPGKGSSAIKRQLHAMARHPWIVMHAVANVVADGWRTPRTAAKSVAALLRGLEHVGWLRGFDPDFIHAHWATYPSTVAWALGRMLGKPFGFTCHAHDIFVERQMLARKIAEASLAVTISRYNIDWLAENVAPCAAGHLELVHCGVDLPAFPCHAGKRDPHTILA